MIFFNWLRRFKKLVFRIGRGIARHVTVCVYDFDPIHDAPGYINRDNMHHYLDKYRQERAQIAESTLHKYFILPIVVFLIWALDSLRIIHQNDWDYPRAPMLKLMTHRMYPPQFHQHGDMLVLDTSVGFLLMGFVLWRRKWLADRYCMYFVYEPDGSYCLIVNGQVWDQQNAQKIYRVRSGVKRTIIPLTWISHHVAYSYFLWNYYHAPFNDVQYYLEMLVFLPIFDWYFLLVVLLMFYHFYVATQYVLIKQSHLLAQMTDLLEILQDSRKREKHSFYSLWQRFQANNRHLSYQCAEIRGYNAFWSYVLSIQFGCEIGDFVYLLYCCFFYEPNIDQLIYYAFYLTEIGVLIFAIIYRCSRVDYNNDRFYLANMKTCILFQLHYRGITPRQLANIEKIATNRNFSRSCFRLSNNYRLDSSAFNMVVYIISTFFLMICRRNRRNNSEVQ